MTEPEFQITRKGRRILAQHQRAKAKQRRADGLCDASIVHPNSISGIGRMFCNGVAGHLDGHRYGGKDDTP